MSLAVNEVRQDKLQKKVQAGASEPALFESFLCGAYPPLRQVLLWIFYARFNGKLDFAKLPLLAFNLLYFSHYVSSHKRIIKLSSRWAFGLRTGLGQNQTGNEEPCLC